MKDKPSSRKYFWAAVVILFFVLGAAGGFVLVRELNKGEKTARTAASAQTVPASVEDLFTLRMFYPGDGKLQIVEKVLPGRTKPDAIAEAVIEQYFKGPGNGYTSPIPQNVRLLGLYHGPGQTLFVDLSDEVRRNFQGDALSEYLLLQGLYESLISNVQDLQDVRLLIEGKEADTLGGHIYLKYPLKSILSYEYPGDRPVTDE